MSRSIPSGLPVVVAVVAVLVIHGAPALAKEKDSGRTFDLGKYGALRMDVPDNWKVKKRRASKNPLEQIEFSSRNDKKFRLILIPSVSKKGSPGFTNPENVRIVVERKAAVSNRNSVEPTLPLTEFEGPEARGFIFVYVDVDDRPKVLRRWTMGIVIVGDVLLSVDMHTRDPGSRSWRLAIEMLKGASHIRPDVPPGPDPLPPRMTPPQLVGDRLVHLYNEVSFVVPEGWVIDADAHMGIRHEASGTTFSFSFDSMAEFGIASFRRSHPEVAGDTDWFVSVHTRGLPFNRKTFEAGEDLSKYMEELEADSRNFEVDRRRIMNVQFRELVVEETRPDGEVERIHDFLTWYRGQGYVLRWTVPKSKEGEMTPALEMILDSFNLKERG